MGLEWGTHAYLTFSFREENSSKKRNAWGGDNCPAMLWADFLGFPEYKMQNILQWKLQRPRSCCDSDSSAPSCICLHLPKQDSKIMTPVLFLALQCIHSCNKFSLSTHCIPSAALDESIKQTKIKWNTIRLGHVSWSPNKHLNPILGVG